MGKNHYVGPSLPEDDLCSKILSRLYQGIRKLLQTNNNII